MAAARPAAVAIKASRFRRDDIEARRSLRADALKRRDDAEDGTEQSDERRHCRRRGEKRDVFLELVRFDVRRAHQRVIDRHERLEHAPGRGGRGRIAPPPDAKLQIQLRVAGKKIPTSGLSFSDWQTACTSKLGLRRKIRGSASSALNPVERPELVENDSPRRSRR